MKYYREEPVGVVATFIVTKTYKVSVYGDTEEDCYDNIENETIKEEDLIDIEYTMDGVDSAGL
jgi:hypothetical protein